MTEFTYICFQEFNHSTGCLHDPRLRARFHTPSVLGITRLLCCVSHAINSLFVLIVLQLKAGRLHEFSRLCVWHTPGHNCFHEFQQFSEPFSRVQWPCVSHTPWRNCFQTVQTPSGLVPYTRQGATVSKQFKRQVALCLTHARDKLFPNSSDVKWPCASHTPGRNCFQTVQTSSGLVPHTRQGE